jgi:hypothetical protein
MCPSCRPATDPSACCFVVHPGDLFGPLPADPPLLPTILQSRSRLSSLGASALAALPLLLGVSQVRAATYTVSDSNWGTSTTTNSFAWALAQANGNLGADTISITPGLAINVDAATEISGGWLTTISEALTIQGNGATLVGNPSFVSSGGTLYDKYNVDVFRPDPLGTDTLGQEAFSFGKLAPGVSLSIHALNSDGLNGYLQLGEGSTASLSNATARNSVSYGQQVPRSVFEAKANSTLNLSQVALERINPELFGVGPAWAGAISGVNATLNMMRSSINQAAAAVGAVVWSGGVANVVSSLISESGGLSVSDDSQPGVMNLVNSLVSVYAYNSNIQRLQAFAGGELNITASSILQDAIDNTDYSSAYCITNPYDCAGKPLTAFNGGTITLKQSLVSLLNTDLIPTGVDSYSEAALAFTSGGNIVALDSVWIQPTPNQDEASLKTLMDNPALLTAGLPLVLEDFGGGTSAYYPLPSGAYPNPDGPLIDQISDADGANQLINPIDGSPILLDVFGQPRTRNGLRTIGAVQHASVPAPLPLAGATAALAWSRRLRRRIRNAYASERLENLD